MEENVYEKFRLESLGQLKKLTPNDIKIFQDDTIAENYTLIIRPDNNLTNVIQKLIAQLKIIDPTQFYYPAQNLHLTIIGNMPVNISEKHYISILTKILYNYTLRFNLKGLGSNNICSSISAYPINCSLHQLRETIRSELNVQGDNFSSILTHFEHVGWINVLRYTHKPNKNLLEALYHYKDTSFGLLIPASIQLIKNTSKILSPTKSMIIKEFSL